VTQVALPGLSRVPYARLVIMALALVAAPVVVFLHAQAGGIGLVPAVGSLVLMVLVVVRLLRVVVGRERARSLLVVRSEQQAAVVRLGLRALAGSEPARLLDEAVAAVAAALRVDHCAVLEATSAETLVLRAGVGGRPSTPSATASRPLSRSSACRSSPARPATSATPSVPGRPHRAAARASSPASASRWVRRRTGSGCWQSPRR
jgi:hypothetical protein